MVDPTIETLLLAPLDAAHDAVQEADSVIVTTSKQDGNRCHACSMC